MRSRVGGDALALMAIVILSLGMLGASRLLWVSLRVSSMAEAQLDAQSLEALTGLALGLLGALVLVWLLASLVIAAAARIATTHGHRRQGAALARLVPGFVARLTLAGLGGSLALASCSLTAAPANADVTNNAQQSQRGVQHSDLVLHLHAEPVHQFAPRTTGSEAETELLSPGWIPQRVPLPMQRLIGGGSTRPAHEVVVREGDSLWAIAARNLPAGAAAEEIAAAWPRWYAKNRLVIGNDPNFLELGTVLQAPGPMP